MLGLTLSPTRRRGNIDCQGETTITTILLLYFYYYYYYYTSTNHHHHHNLGLALR